jgi:hypothetical protein
MSQINNEKRNVSSNTIWLRQSAYTTGTDEAWLEYVKAIHLEGNFLSISECAKRIHQKYVSEKMKSLNNRENLK